MLKRLLITSLKIAMAAAPALLAFQSSAQKTNDFRSRWNNTLQSATTNGSTGWERYNEVTGLWTASATLPINNTTNDLLIRDGVMQTFNNSKSFGMNIIVGEGNAASATVTLEEGKVTDITMINAGKLIVLPVVQLIGPATVPATASITDVSVVDYDIRNPGGNYTNPTVTIGNIWASETSYSINTQVNSGGLLYSCITQGTSGMSGPSGTGTTISDGTVVWKHAGVAATAVATVGTVTRGQTDYVNAISAITITKPGSGYISMPVTLISDAGGSGAGAIAEARIGINVISVINQGEGYSEAPFVNLGSCIVAGNSVNSGVTITFQGNVEFKEGARYLNGSPGLAANSGNGLVIGGSLITSSEQKFHSRTVTTATGNPTLQSTTNVRFLNSGSVISTGGPVSFWSLNLTAGKTLTIGNSTHPTPIQFTQVTPVNLDGTGMIDATYGIIEYASNPFALAAKQTIAVSTFLNNSAKELVVNNPAGVTINGDLTVTDKIQIYSGLLNVAAERTLRLPSANILSGTFGNSKYINLEANTTAGTFGKLQIDGISASTNFPVGAGGFFLPVDIVPAELSDFIVGVFKGATENGLPNGAATADKSKMVDAIYHIERSKGTGIANLKLGYNLGLKGALMLNNFGIARYNGASWDTPVGIANTSTLSAASDFSEFGKFRIENSASASSKINSFDIKTNTYDIELSWALSSEENITKFAIEKSANNTDYTTLAEVVVNNSLAYTTKDKSPAVGNNYYRLVQYNVNGTTEVFGPLTTNFLKPDPLVSAAKQMEYLNRGLIAARINTSQVLVSWRFLGTDSTALGFNVYKDGTKLNAQPITNSTNYLDNSSSNGTYSIKPVLKGIEGNETPSVSTWSRNLLQIPLQKPEGGFLNEATYTYLPNDATVADADGDGEYEIFLKWDPTNSKDNTGEGYTGNVYFDCYKLDGTRLWRIDLGRNMRAGAHYVPFSVFDFDGDGKAELACKTADGTVDGTGTVIGNADADYRDGNGRILSGPEFLTMFDGLTGKALSTVDYYPARGNSSAWGDSYGNRVDRFVDVVAYLDGVHPSLVTGRGYYTRMVRVAWDFVGKQLQRRWIFDSNISPNGDFAGQGNHQMSVADVDGDGKQEILNGSSTINDDGTRLWTDGKGHGDALHVADMDPSTPGIEEWMNHESPGSYGGLGLRLKNTRTGETYWGIPTTGDVGRSMAADIDPNYPGYEVWSTSSGGTYSIKGEKISPNTLTHNFGIWWDGDLSREALDRTSIDKWNPVTKSSNRMTTFYNSSTTPIGSNNSTKQTPCLSADIVGDWREEVIFRTSDGMNLFLCTTPFVTDKRIYTLMHDPQYRVAIAWQNSGYNQPPYPGFFLGNDMAEPPAPNIYTVGGSVLPIDLVEFKAKAGSGKVDLNWMTLSERNNKEFIVEQSLDGKYFTAITKLNGAGNSNILKYYSAVDNNPTIGTSYYRLRQIDFDGKSSLSEVKKVTVTAQGAAFSIVPNPVDNQVRLELATNSKSLRLKLTSINGATMLTAQGSVAEINAKVNELLPSLASGIYIITIIENDQTHVQKLLKK